MESDALSQSTPKANIGMILATGRYRPDYVLRLYGCRIELGFEDCKRIGYRVRDRRRRSNGATLAYSLYAQGVQGRW